MSNVPKILGPNDTGIAEAASLLRAGALVAFPTETVYGLGGDARSDAATAAIYTAKMRPSYNPLIVHVADLASAKRFAVFDDTALRLAEAFWPGPLTLVLPLRKDAGLSRIVTAGLDSVAIRIPAHPVAQALLRAFDGPLAAPSANRSGRISPTKANHVIESLMGRISAVLDGGPCAVGLESTIVGLTDTPTLLRPGGLPAEIIADCLGAPLAQGADPQTPSAPGQLASHYAPHAALRLNATEAATNEILIGFGPVKAELTLSASGDLTEAAANLFDMLRRADTQAWPAGRIAIAPIPANGLGLAINDRLKRAAAPRD